MGNTSLYILLFVTLLASFILLIFIIGIFRGEFLYTKALKINPTLSLNFYERSLQAFLGLMKIGHTIIPYLFAISPIFFLFNMWALKTLGLIPHESSHDLLPILIMIASVWAIIVFYITRVLFKFLVSIITHINPNKILVLKGPFESKWSEPQNLTIKKKTQIIFFIFLLMIIAVLILYFLQDQFLKNFYGPHLNELLKP